MKTTWTILGTMLAASLIAQDNSNSLPAIPAPVSSPAAETAPAATPAPASTDTSTAATPPKHTVKKHRPVHHTRPAAPESSVTLSPGPAVVSINELVVRGQAGVKGEMVSHLHKGDLVTVLEQINLSKHEADEPAQWAKISYPTNAHLWVDGKYIDSNGTVTSKKLNLRAGPGENFSVVGVLVRGAAISQIKTKDHWIQIEPPTNAFAFVAAKYLNQTAAMVAAANPVPPAEAPPTPAQVPEQQSMVMTPQAPPPPPQPTVRIVSHEGIVGSAGSLVAPTDYKLYDANTKSDIDFLYPISKDLDLSRLVDADVIVTGEEGIDQRWPNTPIMAIQSIQVVHTNVIKRLDLTPPRQRH